MHLASVCKRYLVCVCEGEGVVSAVTTVLSVHARWKFERLERSTELTAAARAR